MFTPSVQVRLPPLLAELSRVWTLFCEAHPLFVLLYGLCFLLWLLTRI